MTQPPSLQQHAVQNRIQNDVNLNGDHLVLHVGAGNINVNASGKCILLLFYL